ncbi:copper resistance protein [Vibrio diabolicus]|nr:copper resistance protein [Vibrio diabolicus]
MNLSPSCDLSEKLVQANQHQFDHILIPFFLFALIVALPMASTAIRYLEYTEPIREKYRVHLKLCVFRE